MLSSNKAVFSDNNKTIFLIGIGGVSMCALAEVLDRRGFVVRGSDMQESNNTGKLNKLGIKVYIGHISENISSDIDMIIRTSAVHDDNPEVIKAKELGIPILERAEAWGYLMQEYKNVVCVSGTHGKTTVTSMITHVTIEAKLNPQVMVGAYLPIINGGVRVANGNLFVAEACEYCNSFLNFNPTIAVINNIEEDHLDFFKDIDDIVKSFNMFAKKVPENGAVIVNCDDKNAMRAVEGVSCKVITFGTHPDADVCAKNVSFDGNSTCFKLFSKNEEIAEISMQITGKHNLYNALAAAAASIELGVSPKCVAIGLSKFKGAGRRFEFKGEIKGAKVYDDYAHHPSEVAATLNAVKNIGYKRIVCVFQPHTYTRTAALKEDFIKALSLADKVLLADIYAAREKNIIGISSKVLSDGIENAEYIQGFENLADRLEDIIQPGDIVLTMGAGDIFKLGEMLVNRS